MNITINIKKIIFSYTAAVYAMASMAQNTFSITGNVFDNKHQPVNSAGIHLICDQNNITTTTDKDGYFEVKCTKGRDYKLTISHVGFCDEIYNIKKA